MHKKTLGERLKKLRTERGLSLASLEKEVKISSSTLGYYENNEKDPTVTRLAEIAKFYNVSLDYIAGLSEVKYIDASQQEIYNATGLSGEALSVLKVARTLGENDLAALLSAMVESQKFSTLVTLVSRYLSPQDEYLSDLGKLYIDEASSYSQDLASGGDILQKALCTLVFGMMLDEFKEKGL